mgnify:CR=1 FL=1
MRRSLVRRAPLVTVAALMLASCAPATDPAAQRAPRVDPKALAHHDIRPEMLPKPNVGPDATNGPSVVPRPAGAELAMPPGFRIDVYAEGGFSRPRWLALAPNGDVFVADSVAGKLVILRDADGDGRAETRFDFASGLMQPFGMAFGPGALFVGNTNAVVRFDYTPGQTAASGPPTTIAELPGKGYREHWTRNVALSPDGTKLYATVGSETNVSVEDDARRAAILEMNPDGTSSRIFASSSTCPKRSASDAGWGIPRR